jgi:glutathione S-transferase
MKLYDAMTPNNLRLNVFLKEKGIDPPREKIAVLEGATRTPEFLAINPFGELPTLVLDNGDILTESVAICRYFEAVQPTPRLMGDSAYEQALIEMWNRRMEQKIFGPLSEAGRHMFPFFADKMEQMPAYAETQIRLFHKNLAWFDSVLEDGRPYVVGDQFSIADITGMAMLFVCDISENPIPESLKNVKRWEKTMRERPSFVEIMSQAS